MISTRFFTQDFFDPELDFFTVRNGDSFDITVNDWDKSTRKVYKYAGIPRTCLACTDDVFHHQAFHFVYHSSCKFCRNSRYRFEGIATQKQHIRRLETQISQENLSCHICNHMFSSIQSKNRHIQITHYQSDDKKFPCDQCKTVVYSKQALLYHIERNHINKNEIPKRKCNHCDKLFHLQHSLDVHIRSVHNYKRIKCEYCDNVFTRQSNLDSHYKYVHDILTNEIILDDGCEIIYYECEDCSFKSRYEKNLTRHITNAHSEVQSFSCTECYFKSIYLANLHSHINNFHQQKTKFNCNECDFKTLYERNLKVHIKTVHAESQPQSYKCSKCDFVTAYERSLKRHIKEVHNMD